MRLHVLTRLLGHRAPRHSLWGRTERQEIAAVNFNGIEFEFEQDAGWQFKYSDINFWAFDNRFECPTIPELDEMCRTVGELKNEMVQRIRTRLIGSRRELSEDGAEIAIVLTGWARGRNFTVVWFGGKRWRNMAVDFRIEKGRIMDETWEGLPLFSRRQNR